jgi:hypothetical protein
MDSFKLYSTWHQFLTQWIPDDCPSRLQNLCLLIVGLYHARHVHATRIVRHWPVRAKVPSLTRRLSRFLDNPAVAVRDWYEPVAVHLLSRWAGGDVRLIIDASRVGFGHQLLIVALAYRRRAVPLVWSWKAGSRGHSSGEKQLELLRWVHARLPRRCRVVLVGDSEFGGERLLHQLRRWRWGYVLRQPGDHLVRQVGQRGWQPFAELVSRPGQAVWWADAVLTQQHQLHTALLAYWNVGEDKPWLLATNLADARLTRQAYARRMWIEEMFGDLKGHGFDLEATHLRAAPRLSRLTLAVCLLYVWLWLGGHRVIHAGLRHLVDRHDRRDLSHFRIGWDFIERCLAWNLSISVSLPVSLPPARLVSGG